MQKNPLFLNETNPTAALCALSKNLKVIYLPQQIEESAIMKETLQTFNSLFDIETKKIEEINERLARYGSEAL